jgi:hypothetical protein
MRSAKPLAFILSCAGAGAMAQTITPPVPAASTASASQQPLPATQWTVNQAREAFGRADADGNGVLSRAEAQRLAIMPRSFEDTDTNKDGVIDLNEYLASFGR